MKNGRLLIATMLVGLLFLSVSLDILRVNYEVGSSTNGSRSLNGIAVMNYELVINVSDYNGSTDGERIQSALNDVPPDGAIVFIPEGTWQACNLTALSKTVIMGGNWTVLRRPENTTSPFIIFENRTDFAVVNLIFDGQNIPGASGVQVSNGTSFQIANNTFQDVNTNAIHVNGWSVNFIIENNVLINSNNAPILVFGSPGSRIVSQFLIINNTLTDSREYGKIGVAFADNGTIADNYVLNSTYGIATRDVSNIWITDNRIENVTSFGIYLGTQPGDYGSSNVTIANNYIVGANVGIARYYAAATAHYDDITVENNTIVYSSESDIYADFPASFINNTVSSRDNVTLLTPPAEFVGNVDVNGTRVIPADITGDGKVNMRDVGLVARLYGATRSSGNWNPLADVIQDGVIDMRDLGFVAKCFMFSS